MLVQILFVLWSALSLLASAELVSCLHDVSEAHRTCPHSRIYSGCIGLHCEHGFLWVQTRQRFQPRYGELGIGSVCGVDAVPEVGEWDARGGEERLSAARF